MLPLHLTLTLPSSPFVDALFSIVDDVSLNLMMLILSFFSFDFIRDCRYFSQLFMSAMVSLISFYTTNISGKSLTKGFKQNRFVNLVIACSRFYYPSSD